VSRVFSTTRIKIHRKAAKGQAVIESIASIILFTMMLGLVMAITVYLYFQQALVTAAREGARQAALNADIGSAGSEGNGIGTVQNFVINQVQQTTGQTLAAADITVTPPSASPDQTPGNRTVNVQITWNMTNPVGVGNFVEALGGDGEPFKTIPVSATATMRYEE
jgi:hypothetical protein